MVLARSLWHEDEKQAIGNHEFTLTSRALFSPDGSILGCCEKSKLIKELEKLGQPKNGDNQEPQQPDNQPTNSTHIIAVVDSMVVLRKMTQHAKP